MTDAECTYRRSCLHQLVVFLAKHDREGSVGFILNRPAPVTIGGLMGWGFARPEVRSCAPRPGWPGWGGALMRLCTACPLRGLLLE